MMKMKKKKKSFKPLAAGLCLLLILILFSKGGETAVAGQWVNLSISPGSISFQADDPDLFPKVQANSPVLITISLPSSRNWSLYIRAEGNLVGDQGQIIPISTISWVASPKPPLVDGVLSAGQNIQLGSGRGRLFNSQLNFYFTNSWSYVAGTYTQVVTFSVMII